MTQPGQTERPQWRAEEGGRGKRDKRRHAWTASHWLQRHLEKCGGGHYHFLLQGRAAQTFGIQQRWTWGFDLQLTFCYAKMQMQWPLTHNPTINTMGRIIQEILPLGVSHLIHHFTPQGWLLTNLTLSKSQFMFMKPSWRHCWESLWTTLWWQNETVCSISWT